MGDRVEELIKNRMKGEGKKSTGKERSTFLKHEEEGNGENRKKIRNEDTLVEKYN